MSGNFEDYGIPFAVDSRYTVKERHDLLSLLPENISCNSILEVGCADTTNLKFFASKYNVPFDRCEGVDICRSSNQPVDEINFCHASLEAYLVESTKKFDLILLSDVLEHIYNPWKVLSQLKSALNKSGHILISVPNIQNLQYLHAVNSGDFLYKDTGLFDETHIRFFSEYTLRLYISEMGFKIVKQGWRPDLTLDGLRKDLENIIVKNKYANLDLGNLSIKIAAEALDRYFGQQILICATHEF